MSRRKNPPAPPTKKQIEEQRERALRATVPIDPEHLTEQLARHERRLRPLTTKERRVAIAKLWSVAMDARLRDHERCVAWELADRLSSRFNCFVMPVDPDFVSYKERQFTPKHRPGGRHCKAYLPTA